MVREPEPVFVAVTVCEALLPTDAVTETESEKKAQLALADIIGKNSDLVGSAVGGLISKSVSATDIKTESDAVDSAGELERARDRYFDALVEVQTTGSGKGGEESQRNLGLTKDKYNEVRRSQGLEQIQ